MNFLANCLCNLLLANLYLEICFVNFEAVFEIIFDNYFQALPPIQKGPD